MSTNTNESKMDAVLRDVAEPEASRLKEIWEMADLGDIPAIAPSQLDDTLSRLHGLMGQRGRTPVQRLRTPPVISRTYALAAAAAIVFAIGIGWWLQPVSVDVPFGETRIIEMSDGSTVVLNSGSSIRYARKFGDLREVDLEGEAYFDVTSDGRPFRVNTFNAHIDVLGTRFNVRSRKSEQDAATEVALESGSVRISHLTDPQQVATLEPGDVRFVGSNRRDAGRNTATLTDALAWTTGDFVFKDQPLDRIIDEVQRRFNTSVKISDPELLDRRYTFVVRQPRNVEMIVRDIASTTGLRYRVLSDGFQLFAE